MRPVEASEVFRAGVGIVVERGDGKVLALERLDVSDAWQLPQGGLAPGEDTEVGARRELHEEVGLTDADVEFLGASRAWIGYELPSEFRKPKTGRGQVHRWFLFRLRPDVKLPPL